MRSSRPDIRRAPAEAAVDGYLAPIPRSLPATVPFVGPEALERARGKPFAARLGANESLFGPSAKAVDGDRRGGARRLDVWRPGDPMISRTGAGGASRCRSGLRFTVGEGIDGLPGAGLSIDAWRRARHGGHRHRQLSDLQLSCRRLRRAAPRSALSRRPSGYRRRWPTARAHATAPGCSISRTPTTRPAAWHAAEDVRELAMRLPADCLLLSRRSLSRLRARRRRAADRHPPGERVIRFRTFSKAYGLAGPAGRLCDRPSGADPRLRPDPQSFRPRARGSGRRAGRARGSRASFAPPSPGSAGRGETRSARSLAPERAEDRCRSGCQFRRGRLRRRRRVRPCSAGRRSPARDVFVRMPGASPIDRCIRVSCGGEPELALFAEALPGALEDARAAAGR